MLWKYCYEKILNTSIQFKERWVININKLLGLLSHHRPVSKNIWASREAIQLKDKLYYQRVVAQLAARSYGDLEVTDSNHTIRWETFGLNLQTRSSRISRIPPKVGSVHLWSNQKKRKKDELYFFASNCNISLTKKISLIFFFFFF